MRELIRMDEYCDSVRDGTHDTPKPTDTGYYLVTSRAVKGNTLDFSECYFISPDDYNKVNQRSKVDKWDVIMTMIGTVGRLHLVKQEPNYAIKNMALFKIGDESKAKWLYYYLSTPSVQNYFEMIASGTSQHFIGLGHLRKLKILDQSNNSDKIVQILSHYDDLIETNNKRIKILEQMAENLYKEWFVRFRFPGHEQVKFEHGIPEGWNYYRLDQQIIFDPTLPIKKGTPVKSIPMEAVSTTSMIIDESYFSIVASPSGSHSQNGDVLVARITPCLENGKTGFVMGLDAKETATGSTEFIVLRSKTLSPYLVYCIARSYYFRQTAILSMNGADGRQRVDVKKLKSLKYCEPPKNLVDHFTTLVKPVFDEVFTLHQKNLNLAKQRNLLLPRLMSGKLEVR